MKKWILSAGMTLAAVTVLTACGEASIEPVENNEAEGAEVDEPTDNEEVEEEVEEDVVEESLTLGDKVNFDGLEITLNEAYTSAGSDWETPENDQYVILDLTIENTTEEAANISTLLQMSLKDEDSYTHDIALFTDVKGSLDGEVGPGRDMRGEVAFDVDQSGVYEFIFEDPFASGQAIWTIEGIE
ncbi:DUF4352 domain-containing protein [Alkalicoccobacillus porphyridii]|nr:DUF4352 domain-containing protein [Alkalicoccobacillus porphyridii]